MTGDCVGLERGLPVSIMTGWARGERERERRVAVYTTWRTGERERLDQRDGERRLAARVIGVGERERPLIMTAGGSGPEGGLCPETMMVGPGYGSEAWIMTGGAGYGSGT